jgi:phosphoribosylformimino-5-aminoimidazole carboxamide ribotide isomerase
LQIEKALQIIPVIDLLNGQVVHAKHGNRASYQPMQSQLCPTSEPMAMLDAIMGLQPFEVLYIADLNAIQNIGHHQETIVAIKQRYPELKLWVDAGFKDVATIAHFRALAIEVVLGSESLQDIAHYEQLLSACDCHAILSLDFKANQYQGPAELMQNAALWPSHVIAMTLSKVGSQAGPDLPQLQAIQSLAEAHKNRPQPIHIFAAGGVRHDADLLMLQQQGVTGALVASALHAGNIKLAAV